MPSLALQSSNNRLFMQLWAYRLVLFSTLLIVLVCATAASAQQPVGELRGTGASVEGPHADCQTGEEWERKGSERKQQPAEKSYGGEDE